MGHGMAHTITLTDEEYEALAAAAASEGRTVEELVHATLAERLATEGVARTSEPSALIQRLYDDGLILHIPDRRPDTPEEEEELERLATSIRPGKTASDIVSENRGLR